MAHIPEAQPTHVCVYVVYHLLNRNWLSASDAGFLNWLEKRIRNQAKPIVRTMLDIIRHAASHTGKKLSTTEELSFFGRVHPKTSLKAAIKSIFDSFVRNLHSIEYEKDSGVIHSSILCLYFVLLREANINKAVKVNRWDLDSVPIRAILRYFRLLQKEGRHNNSISFREIDLEVVALVRKQCPHVLHNLTMKYKDSLFWSFDNDSNIDKICESSRRQQFSKLMMRFMQYKIEQDSPLNILDLFALSADKIPNNNHIDILSVVRLINVNINELLMRSQIVLAIGFRQILNTKGNNRNTFFEDVVCGLWMKVLHHHAFPFKWQINTANMLVEAGIVGRQRLTKRMTWQELGQEPFMLLREHQRGWFLSHPLVLQIVLCITETLLVRVTGEAMVICKPCVADKILAVGITLVAEELLSLLDSQATLASINSEYEHKISISRCIMWRFLDWLFTRYPLVLKAIHMRHYPDHLVVELVRRVDSVRGCFDFMSEILDCVSPPNDTPFPFTLALALVCVFL